MALIEQLSGVGDGHDAGPGIQRIRQDVRFRSIRVERIEQITPAMRRIVFTGDDLADFSSPAFDDHIKLLIPTGSAEKERRDYTPRRYDPAARSLTLDFALHEAGPATRWAITAQRGDQLRIGGPKGSTLVSPDVRRWLLIGDETALPAIGRRIEEAATDTHLTSIVAVTGATEEQSFDSAARVTTHWVHRPSEAANDPAPVLKALRDVIFTPDTFVWVAAEAGVARAVREWIVETRAHRRSWTKAGGYWVKGQADANERLG